MKIFGREPALWLAVISALLTFGVTFGLDWLTAGQAAAILVACNAAVGVATAVATRPVAPAAFTYAVSSAASLAAAYGFELSQATVGAVNGLVVAVLVLITRQQVSPSTAAPPRTSLNAYPDA